MVNFPNSIDDNTTLYLAVNNLRTRLTANISAGDTSIPVITTSGFPSTGFISILTGGNVVNTEALEYSSTTSTTFEGITRGVDGTPALPHNINDAVDLTIVAPHHNALKDAVIELEHFVGVSGSENFVTDVNGIQESVTIAGAGKASVLTAGQTITISGQPDDLDVDSLNGLQGTVSLSGINGASIHLSGQQVLVSGAEAVTSLNSLQNDVQIAGAGGVSVSEMGQTITISGASGLTVRESDGNPSVSNVNTIVVTTGTLTDDGGGQVTIQTGAAGGSGGGSGVVGDFSGAVLSLQDFTVTSGNLTVLTWSGATYDTDGYFSLSDPSRLTITNPDTQYVVLKGTIHTSPAGGSTPIAANSPHTMLLRKNGSQSNIHPEVVGKKIWDQAIDQSMTNSIVSPPIEVVQGDYFDLAFADTHANSNITSNRTWFALEDVTPRVETSASGGGSSAFSGAQLTLSGSNVSVPHGLANVITLPFDHVLSDTDGFALSPSPSGFEIPSGLGITHVVLNSIISWDTATEIEVRFIRFEKDGAALPAGNSEVIIPSVSGIRTINQCVSHPIEVTSGEVLTVVVGQQGSGAALDILAEAIQRTSFSIYVVGRS